METWFQTKKPVTISYYELEDKDKDLSAKIEDGFGPNGLGVISVSDVPGFSALRERLLNLSPRLFKLPDKVKKELEDLESRHLIGWSLDLQKHKSGKLDPLRSSFFANPIVDTPTTDNSLLKRYPTYCRPNKWPTNELPELEVEFKALGTLMIDVGLLLAYHCDRHGSKERAVDDDEGLQGILRRSRCHKGRLLTYFPRQESECVEDVSSISSWLACHTDWGSLTGLACGMFTRNGEKITCPDNAAGLFVKTRNSEIIKVLFGEDEIAYQIGETTETLSKGRLSATPHGVRAPEGEASLGVERTTFIQFMQPNWDEVLHLPDEIRYHQDMVSPNETLTFGEYSERRISKGFD